jgi:hypothetical protein
MARVKDEDFLTLYLDPGEDTGWALGYGILLLGGDTNRMWELADEVWLALDEGLSNSMLGDPGYLRDDSHEHLLELPIRRIVCEDFRLYPKVMRTGALDWNPVRTARVIGAYTFMCRHFDLPFITQPASIKAAAIAGGAKELYLHPTHENRHHNDAIQHFVYYTNTELLGVPMPKRDNEEVSHA